MKSNFFSRSILFPCILATTANFASALELPEGHSIYGLHSSSESIRGFVSSAESFYEHNSQSTLHAVDLFTHVVWMEGFQDGEYVQNIESNGFSKPYSIIASGGLYGPAEACFDKQIPMNATLLTYDLFNGSYETSEVVIPSYRSDRMCMEVAQSNYSAEFMVIID